MLRPLFLFLSLIFITACSDSPSQPVTKFVGSTMGTHYNIILVGSKTEKSDLLKKQVDDLLLEINRQMSTYISDSEISTFNRYKQQDWFAVSTDFAQVVSTAQRVSKLSQGAFDITVAPLIDLWGFGATTQLTTPTDEQIQTTLRNTGYKLLEVRNNPPALRKLNKNIRIDLSAIAKGFAVDKIAELLNQERYTNYLVEIGGEVRNRGFNQKGKPWKVGIETPEQENRRLNKTLLTSNLSIATSGDYRNYFIKDGQRYSHTIDPTTGKPITHKLASITVLHESTMIADAYATALMVMGDVKGRRFSEDNHIKSNMIIRNTADYENWQNIDEVKMPQSLQKCPKRGGCVYF